MDIYEWLGVDAPPAPAPPAPALPLGLSPREAALFLTRGTLPAQPEAFASEEGDCVRWSGEEETFSPSEQWGEVLVLPRSRLPLIRLAA